MCGKEHRILELMCSNLIEKAAAALKIWSSNKIVREWLCTYDRQSWCDLIKDMAGAQLHEILICLIDVELEKRYSS